MTALAWVLTIIGSLIGGGILLTGYGAATTAPQQAAAGAVGAAFVILPYCFARACEALGRMNRAPQSYAVSEGNPAPTAVYRH